jgi:DNA-binding NarL/FixJ family response regulator
MISAGLTDREIAAALGIARRTTSKHVSTILQKLDAANRTEAATTGVRQGILDGIAPTLG